MKNFFRSITNNFFAKVVCLLLAVGLWIYVGTGQAKIGAFPGKIPVSFINVANNLVTTSDIDSVSLRLVANSANWQNLNANSFTATVDLNGLTEGTYELPVKVTSQVPIQIVEILPAKILVRLEKIAKKEIPINLLIEDKPASGLVVGDWKISPDKIEVAGAESVVEKIFEATAKLSLSGESSEIQKMIKPVVLDSQGNEVKNLVFSPEQVEVKVPLVQASSAKTVGIKVLISGQPADGFWVSKIESTPSSAAVTASALLISQISFIETKEVDINGLSKDKEFTTTLKTNPGVTVLDNVNLVKVKIYISPISSIRQMDVGFNWLNLSSGLSVASVEPQEATVVLTGSAVDLARLKSGEVLVNLDLGGLTSPGTYSLDISRSNIGLPNNVSFSSVVPSAVNVRLVGR